MTHAVAPLRLAPEHLDPDALPALHAALRDSHPAAVEVAAEGLARIPAPALQLLLAARAEGRGVMLEGAGEGLALALATLGLGDLAPGAAA